jgi:hypothetical protein
VDTAEELIRIYEELKPYGARLVAVSKTHPPETIFGAYQAGHRDFGENRVQELLPKYEALPKDIRWHLIGHLQSNKVKYIAPFVSMIHSVDSLKLLKEINKEAQKNNRIIDCLLQIHIAKEETKFGLTFEEADQLLTSDEFKQLNNICIRGLMGMATLSENSGQIRKEFRSLSDYFKSIINNPETINFKPEILSMGMSGDYAIALEEGSTMIRIGSAIFGSRNNHSDGPI